MIYKYSLETGQILACIHAPLSDIEHYPAGENEAIFISDVYCPDGYVENGSLLPLPESPAPHHEWDWTTKSWLPNLDAARESKLQQVAVELNTRLYLPCNGFDADQVSRERISGMIARLQRGDGLPAGWVGWRDAENAYRWGDDDAETVLANLTALSRAIEDREQALLVASWTHKANIAALADIDSILAYDVTANWPV
jgi:hypothetical protein